MSISLKEIRNYLPRILNPHYNLLPALFSELRQRQPRILAAAVHSPRRVRFALDNPDLMLKPNPAMVATYVKNTKPRQLVVKTRAEIVEEERVELFRMKRSVNAWRPRSRKITRTPLTKEEDEKKAFAELTFNPLDVSNL